jgi:molybdate transport system substrate-binding protein
MILAVFPAMARSEGILVSAAASLTDALTEIGREYRIQRKAEANFNFGPSSTLARQIEEGAPVDIFFSADLEKMDDLEQHNLLEPGTRQNLLSNQLVIVVPADSRLAIASDEDLLRAKVKRIAIAEPTSVPAGIYARKYLQEEGLWQRLMDKVIPVLDVRAALASVAAGNVAAGFVYRTDAVISNKVKIAYAVPTEKGPKITYPVAILRESTKKDSARDFMNFLLGPAAKEIFKKFGFIVLK